MTTNEKETLGQWVNKVYQYLMPGVAMTADELAHVAKCLDHIRRWYYEDYPLGSFLAAVVKNDLMGAITRADDVNRKALPLYAAYLHNVLPGDWQAKGELK